MARIARIAVVLAALAATRPAAAQLDPGAPSAPALPRPPGGHDWRVERTFRVHGFTVTRWRRWLEGLPVARGTGIVAVRTTRDGAVDLVSGDGGPRAHDAAPARVSLAAAEQAARELLPRTWRRVRVAGARLVWADAGGVLVRAHELELLGAAPTERAWVWVDARDPGVLPPAILGAEPAVQHALGRVYDPNPVVAMMSTTDVELPDLLPGTRLTGTYVSVYGCQPSGADCAPTQHATADAAGNFLYDPEEPSFSDEFSEVSAYYHVSKVAAYFREVQGFTWTCCDDPTATLMNVISNYTETTGFPYENAAYSPSSCRRMDCGTILLGQGQYRDYGYDGEVVYHEFTHGVVSETANITGFALDDLGIHYEPLGVNEGTADFFSGAVSDDPSIAEYFAGGSAISAHTALRVIDNDLRCPEDLIGEGHLDGRIFSGLGWTLRSRLLAGSEAAEAVVFAAVTSIGGVGTFGDATEALLATARTMEGEGRLGRGDAERVRTAIEERNLGACERIVALGDGVRRLGYSGTEFATGSLGQDIVPIHYRIDVPADATRLVIEIRRLTLTGVYEIHYRVGRPVEVDPARRPAIRADGTLGIASRHELRVDSVPALPRCQTLHLAVAATDLTRNGQSLFEISATVERSGEPIECPEVAADAGRASDTGPGTALGPVRPRGGGCACQSSPSPRGEGAFLFCAAWLLWRSRPRRLRY